MQVECACQGVCEVSRTYADAGSKTISIMACT